MPERELGKLGTRGTWDREGGNILCMVSASTKEGEGEWKGQYTCRTVIYGTKNSVYPCINDEKQDIIT